jgi:phosphate acyltransferase
MGAESSPQELYPAVLQAAEQLDNSTTLVVFATASIVEKLVNIKHPVISSVKHALIEFHSVHDFIAMKDEPLTAIRHKKGSSLVTGIRLLKKRHLDAFVSAGNTGALIASASLSLPMLPGISRPALLAVLPTQRGPVAILDVGGNVSCKANHLVQFAHLGSAYQRCILGIERPTVGLLNIGIESKKGTLEVRQAYQILKDLQKQGEVDKQSIPMTFLGNIEGRDVFQGKVDVLVTDGFTGNVLLKTSEGLSSFIFSYLRQICPKQASKELQNLLSMLQKQFNYTEYPGAILCGVDGIVVKCHGNATKGTMLHGIEGAIKLVQKRMIAQIKSILSSQS